MKRVVVEPYNAAWPGAFAQIRDALWPAIADVALRIEHVGSTAVPGLAAKPVIDVDIVLPDPGDISTVVTRLAPLGYAHRGTRGVPGRDAFQASNALPVHHLYACRDGAVALRNHLLLRDALRASRALAAEYGALKQRLAVAHAHDVDAYIDGKTEFIVRVLRDVGLDADSIDAVVAANRIG